MPRISRLDRSEVSPDLTPVYDKFLRDRGNVPYFFRTLAHRPEIFRTAAAHMEAVLKTGTLPTRLKELVVVRTSQLNCTAYCLASHTAISLKLGWSPEHIEALKSWRDSPLFSEAEKEAIHLAEAMTNASHEYTDADMARLRRFYSEGEVIELMAAVGLFNYFNRFNNLLQMEPTKPATAEELAEAGIEPVTA
ncbi:MAG TPA: carboxymuconolactone decarboxylase family protein [Acidobacteriaceae bacterium]|nr:carboxymuconolactone decarboxylase family protein [Acidobacteriaceae bacterium]